MLDRWRRSLRVGLAAYRLGLPLSSVSTTCPSSPKFATYDEIHTFLSRELEEGRNKYPFFDTSLPPVVLQLLLSLSDGRLDDLTEYRPLWTDIQINQLGGRNQGVVRQSEKRSGSPSMPLFLSARIIAHHILYGVGRPVSVFRFAKSLFGQKWREYERDLQALDILETSLEILRSPWRTTQEKVCAVENLSVILEAHWPHVENALYHQLFSWPLLTFAGDIGISLPVSIDVHLDHKAEVEVRGDELIDTSGWEQSLWHAADVARVMWLGKHANKGEFREEVRGSSIVYDFSSADKIVAGFPEPFTLDDASMEAYFSQVILCKFLGNTVSPACVITGEIGDQRTEDFEKIADFGFKWAMDVPKKMKYVFRTQFFERVILPDVKDLEPEDKDQLHTFLQNHSKEQSAEIVFAKHLQHVADAFQVGGWRQFKYIRTPDIGWYIHPSGTRLPAAESEGVRRCLELLKNNREAVLDLTGRIDPIDLAGALWHINTVLRERFPIRKRPPMMSWAFLRAIHEEQDTRFWHVVWRITGASVQDYKNFHSTATPDAAAEAIRAALNCFIPTYHCPSHRAPDILVLLGTNCLSTSLNKARNPLLRSHAFDPILERLRRPGALDPTPTQRMREFIGSTRLIIFKEDEVSLYKTNGNDETSCAGFEEEIAQEPAVLKMKSFEQKLIRQLEVFRFGFTQQMAGVLWEILRYENLPVRNLLKKFVRKDILRYGFGEYHIPGKVRRNCETAINNYEEAQKHYAAGIALAPYLSAVRLPGVTFDKAFYPEIVNEASYHLSEAYGLLDKKDSHFGRQLQVAITRLYRFAQYPGWHSVVRLSKVSNPPIDGYEVSMDLLEDRKIAGITPHPHNYLTAIRAVERRWAELRSQVSYKQPDEVSRLFNQIQVLFAEAEQACDDPNFKTENEYNRLAVITARALFIFKHRDCFGPKSSEEAEGLSEKALLMIKSSENGSAALGEWYEQLGDLKRSNKEAEEVYGLGTQWTPDWHQLWIKYIGCACMAHGDIGRAEMILHPLPSERIISILRSSLKGFQRDAKQGNGQVRSRWQSGINFMRRLYHENPAILTLILQYDDLLNKW